MKPLNLDEDVRFYLTSGPLTTPFLDNQFVYDKVMRGYDERFKTYGKNAIFVCLFKWISHNIKFSDDAQFIKKWKFQRTSQEIWESKFATGCTDYAILFATFARQLGISSTILHTAEFKWLKRLQNKEDTKAHIGHAFCECFYEGEWKLVDPTFHKIQKNYNPKKLVLDYDLGGDNIFIPYSRGLDLGKRQTTGEYTELMDKECENLTIV